MTATAKAVQTTGVLSIGQPYGGGFFSGITQEDGKRYINITAAAEHELKGKWGEYGQKIEGADSYTDSRANTEAMAAAGGELARAVLALTIGGHSDWGIPARDVQEPQYRHLKPTAEENYCSWRDGDNPSSLPAGHPYSEQSPAQTSVEAFREGGPEAFQDAWYWSSTQRSADTAYFMGFGDGTQSLSAKHYELRARPVRRELIID
jgi:hypothetical protein